MKLFALSRWCCASLSRPARAAAIGICLASAAAAQEANRISLASQSAAEARRKATSTLGYYNLRLGPTAARFQAGYGVMLTDNAYYSNIPKSDVVLTPTLNAQFWWPVTEKNSLNLSLGGGYYRYLENPSQSRFFLNPGSELSFDLYVKDFRINLHDRFAIFGQTYENPAANGRNNDNRFENSLGVTTTWDLNKLVVWFGYDHLNYMSLSGNSSQPDGQSEVFWTRAGLALSSAHMVGVEGGITLISLDSPLLRGGYQYNAGGFYVAKISDYIDLKFNLGYTYLDYETGGGAPPVSGTSALYGELAIHHRVNDKIQHTVSGGRTVDLGLRWGGYSQALDYYYARWNASWSFIRDWPISTMLYYENGTERSLITDHFERFGGGITLGRGITRKLSASLGYSYYWRGSDLPGRSYIVNNLTLNLAYSF